MALADKLKKSIKEKWCLHLNTSHPDGDKYDGVVVHIGREFVAIMEMRDLEFDGLQIFPKRSLKGCRDGKFERAYNAVLRHNGEIKKLRAPRWLRNKNTIREVLEYCLKKDIWPAVESVDNDEDSFYLGSILTVNKNDFEILTYDAEGEWDEFVNIIPFKEVIRIEIDSKYVDHFNAFMRSNPAD